MSSAQAGLLCANQADQGGFGSDTFTPFAGTQHASCGTDSGVTLAIDPDTDYAKLTWDASNSPTGYPPA